MLIGRNITHAHLKRVIKMAADRFNNVLMRAKEKVSVLSELKEEQIQVISLIVQTKTDCICVLPTGYGKSLIYQLLPFVFDEWLETENSCILVISPLTAIIEDQIAKLSPTFHAMVNVVVR